MTETQPWLVAGGAGYIGAHVVRRLVAAGIPVVVLDNLSTGFRKRIPNGVDFVEGDCTNVALVKAVLAQYGPEGVIHLAAFKHARESSSRAGDYYFNNVGATLALLQAIAEVHVRSLVFSSSCSIFGAASAVGSTTPPSPLSPYARTKYVSELIIDDVAPQLNLSTITLRYFNVIGNDDFPMAPDTSTECLVPNAYLKAIRDEPVQVYGVDFDTRDGSALRDYVDVRDLADLHVLAVRKLMNSTMTLNTSINVGTGTPTSVLEVLNALERTLGTTVHVNDAGRNMADPPAVWVAEDQARLQLGWSPQFTVFDSIDSHHRGSSP